MADEDKYAAIASQVMIQLLDDLFNKKNLKVVDEIFANDCIYRGPAVETVGKEDFIKKFLQPLFDAFPDLNFVSHEAVVDLPTIVNRFTFTGTQKGEYVGESASNKKITWSGITLNRLNESGKIIEINSFFDRKDIIDQIKA